MPSIKRNDIILYIVSIGICAVSYIILNKNIEISLLPHKIALEYLFNFNFVFIENEGYAQANGLFILARNCLGVKLLISLFLIMVLGFLHKFTNIRHKLAALVKFYLIALVLALAVNIIRTAASVPFCTWERYYLIHNIISFGLYFASGLILYFIMEKNLPKKEGCVNDKNQRSS